MDKVEQPSKINLEGYRTASLLKVTDEELTKLKGMSDDNLLRSATTLDLFSGVESMRRLRIALQNEERAIKRLTGVLVFFTVILVLLTGVLVWLGVGGLHH
jgi:hypothetical protein